MHTDYVGMLRTIVFADDIIMYMGIFRNLQNKACLQGLQNKCAIVIDTGTNISTNHFKLLKLNIHM